MKEMKYWQEDTNDKGDVPERCQESKYSKWKVESALRTLQEAQEVMADSKMVGYVKKCIAAKQAETSEVSRQLGLQTKVSAKLKEVFDGE